MKICDRSNITLVNIQHYHKYTIGLYYIYKYIFHNLVFVMMY
jgi:hypothetical protein